MLTRARFELAPFLTTDRYPELNSGRT